MIGWVEADESDKERLEEIGVKVGVYSTWINAFRGCLATEACVGRLEKYWDRPFKFIKDE